MRSHVCVDVGAEAELVLRHPLLPFRIASLDDMLVAARHLLILGPDAVLLEGGHVSVSQEEMHRVQIPEGITLDIRPAFLLGENLSKHAKTRGVKTITLYPPCFQSNSTHGTGYTPSAALACALGNGMSVQDATAQATLYTDLGIETAPPLYSVSRLVVQPPIGQGYARQSVVYPSYKVLHVSMSICVDLYHFGSGKTIIIREHTRRLLAAKSHDFAPISSAAKVMQHIADEKTMHVSYCAKCGITLEELERTPESPATMAYGAFLIDVGLQGDTAKLLVALAACLLGYGEVGLWLEKEAAKPDAWVKREGNPYREWIEDYAGEGYQDAVSVGLETIEAQATADPPSPVRYAAWLAVWERCVRLEINFGIWR
ncbi:hypothetical protein JVT61DRAFT_2492 [Boletus reticuloceps]|uniref:Uncharacterized protein n=1 Tax=Boletus reticuloceps TaxID=495285 RepID=A0A8I2YQU5_9AGAM|nr:hypothetical protein JVT61DRAFT_2492 [Boletus reticuloceps]